MNRVACGNTPHWARGLVSRTNHGRNRPKTEDFMHLHGVAFAAHEGFSWSRSAVAVSTVMLSAAGWSESDSRGGDCAPYARLECVFNLRYYTDW